MLRRLTAPLLAAATLCVVLATCTDAPTSSSHRISRVAIAPVFTSSAQATVGRMAAFALTIDNVRIVLVKPVADTVKDTVVTITPDQQDLEISIPVVGVVPGDILGAGIIFRAGDQVLFAGAAEVTAVAPTDDASPTEVPTSYVGPAADAISLAIGPRDTSIVPSDTLVFRFAALNATGDTVAGAAADTASRAFVAWQSSDATIADVDAHGVLHPHTAGTVQVNAHMLNGLADSTNVTITQPPSQLAVVTAPSAHDTSGVPFATQPVLRLEDSSGSPVAVAGWPVTAAISAGGGTLGGTATVLTDTSGVATFTDLSITGATGAHTLTFSSGALSVTASVTLDPLASKLGFHVAPSTTATNHVKLATQPVVELEDGSGAPVAQSGVRVTVALTAGNGTLDTTLTATTNSSGQATFTNLTLGGTVGTYTLSFSAPKLTAVTANVTLRAGAAASVQLDAGNEQIAVAGTTLSTNPRVLVTDVDGNAVSGATVTFQVAGGGGKISGKTIETQTTAANGKATVSSWQLGSTGGTNSDQLTATVSGVPHAMFNATGVWPVSFASMGQAHACALDPSGHAFCWGSNAEYGIGRDTSGGHSSYSKPTRPADSAYTYTSIAVGEHQSCGMVDTVTYPGYYNVYCWGADTVGQLGDDNNSSRWTWSSGDGVESYGFLRSFAIGANHGCGINTDSTAICWGDNTHGQLGDGDSYRYSQAYPYQEYTYSRWIAITASDSVTCGIDSTNTVNNVWCWGDNAHNQLNAGAVPDSGIPFQVGLTWKAKKVVAGGDHVCAINASDNLTYCWGESSSGQRGGSSVSSPIIGFTFTKLALGRAHSCGLTSAGVAYCWGDNSSGQLGDGTNTNRSSPTAVAGGLTFTNLTAAGDATCGVMSGTNGLFCWGNNSFYQLGDGGNTSSNMPVAVRSP